MPRCENEFAHEHHVVSLHLNHFHGANENNPEIAHIGHDEHGDETSIINLLQHLFDDIDSPKEKCESGFFASIHSYTPDVKSYALYAVLKYPTLFLPAFDDSIKNFEYKTPNYSPPDQRNKQQRGPPFFLV